ncbi:MAG: pyruvate, phosphate dikinase [Candidatus Bipolaricaulota bacterium]
MAKAEKYVYRFGGNKAEGGADLKMLLGGKGANLGEMARLGIPVPPGFTITTEACLYYREHQGSHPPKLKEEVREGIQHLEETTGRKFGDPERPLLVSVRSGAAASMPGMMDTVLNLGLNDRVVQGLAAQTDPRFAYDAYRRLVAMYGSVVLGVKDASSSGVDPFHEALDGLKDERGARTDLDLSTGDLKELVSRYNAAVEQAGKSLPNDPWDQLWGAIAAVFGSWDNPRARVYRRMHQIPDTWGTAVNVQAMVFGNLDESSGTGVMFTRDPATGENRLYGEYLLSAQGEDVVAGTRTPQPIASAQKSDTNQVSLEETMPEIHRQLVEVRDRLERHYRDMQDTEFTIERGTLYVLQTRTGKRTGFASVRIAVEMVEEGLISEDEAILRLEPAEQLSQLLQPIFDPAEKDTSQVLAKGLPAGPGAASGRVVVTADEAVRMSKDGEPVVLVRHETSPDDIAGMAAAEGILTSRGGMTSHAAVVARQMGKVAVVGCEGLTIDYKTREVRVQDRSFQEGDWLSFDGTSGEVLAGKVATRASEVLQVLIDKTLSSDEARIYQLYDKLMSWADARRRLGVRANADKPEQAATALAFGAEGIGLCRTEHMFFGEERTPYIQQTIITEDPRSRDEALTHLLELQTEDFAGILRVMDGRPVIIRLLDPPMHEFLPSDEENIAALARRFQLNPSELKQRIEELHEFNPMLGHRGCRLGITHPELYDMQVEAIFRAAAALARKGLSPRPYVMVPLVGLASEMRAVRCRVDDIAGRTMEGEGVDISYKVGTMIEVPRACVVADEIAQEAQFFSFGTNDLTQMTFGFSRDDAGTFINRYLEESILPLDPFQTIDRSGVGALMQLGTTKGREASSEISVGICGEHGGESGSVQFCHQIGLDYVSASSFRIPVARLAAAQAALKE